MNWVFTDTGYWIGLRNRTDANHARAMSVTRRLMREKCRILVTPFIFAEAYATFSRSRPLREQVARDIWQNPIVQLEQVSFADQNEALDLLKMHADKSFSFVDAISFVVMERLAIRRAVSFDQHFQQYGKFEILDSE